MEKPIKVQPPKKLAILLTGFAQVFFVAVNTFFIAKELYFGIFLAAFTISFIWSFNVKKMAFGGMRDRILYSLGAALGSLSGAMVSSFLYNAFS